MKVWGQPTRGRSKDHPLVSTEVSTAKQEVPSELDIFLTEEAAQLTRGLLNSQGWCLWKCSTLGGEVIVVVRDELVHGVPEGYVVYTEAELEELCWADVSEATLWLVHEAKKLADAKVV